MSQLFKNNATTRLVAAVGASDTTFTVTTGEGALFPAITSGSGDHFDVTLENSTGDKEIIRIVDRSADVFTIGVAGSPVPSALGRGIDNTTAMGFSAADLVELRLTAGFIDALKEGSVVFVIDGGGADLTTGIKGWIEAPFNGTIKSARLFSDVTPPATGSVTVHVWKDTYANYPPTDPVDEMTPPAGNSISGGVKEQFTDLSSWLQKGFSKGEIFAFSISACTGIQKLTISLTVDRY